MDAPRIQYAKTEDGVNIAYWTVGSGPPLVHSWLWISHAQLEWQFPEMRRWYERLAQERTLIRYDARGSGLSDRDVELSNVTIEAHVLDLEAVVDRLKLERFALLGLVHTGPVAIEYAVRHPERVSHLLLWSSYTHASEFSQSGQIQAIRGLAATDWETYSETTAHVLFGWSEGLQARRFADLIRESITPELLQAGVATVDTFDVTSVLPDVTAPTFVLHRRGSTLLSVKTVRDLASRLPNARLVLFEGDSMAPYLGDTEAVADATLEFLNEEGEAGEVVLPQGTATILFTDMASSTSLTQQLGDAAAQEVRRAHNDIVRSALTAHAGSEIKHTGDGIMASFATASAGLNAAITIQRGVAAHKQEHPDSPLAVYAGLNAGEPIAEDDDLFGTSVDLTARICDQAQPGQILASDVVRQLAAGKDFLFSDLGQTELRGFEDPVKLWEVRWREQG